MTGTPPSGACKPQLADLSARLWGGSQAGAWNEVAAVAGTLRHEFPAEPIGYLRGALALRLLRRFQEAETVIQDAVRRFPDDPQALIEAARVAQGREDWHCAVKRSAVIVERFPDQAAGFLIQAHAHRCLKELAEAERLLARGAALFPDLVDFIVEGSWLALAHQRWALAVEQSAKLMKTLPAMLGGYQVAVAALKNLKRWPEVRQVLDQAVAHCGSNAWILSESLQLAQHQDDRERIVELAKQIVKRTPSDLSAYHVGARAYRQLGRLDDAERLLQRAMSTLPPNAQVLSEHGWAAQDRGDWVAADRRWSEAKRQFPDDRTVALWHARVPVYARTTFKKADVLEAHKRYSEIHERFPDLAVAYADHIKMFRTANSLQEAEEVGKLARARMPADLQIHLECSQIASDQGRPQEALQRLEEVWETFRDDLGFQCRLVAALAHAGKNYEAEALCSELIARHETELQPHIEYAEIAMRRNHWTTAAERWSAVDRRFPGLPWVRKRLFDAQLATTEEDRPQQPASGPAAPPGFDAGPAAGLPTESLVALFEGLSGTFQGCEFGRVQRHFGCEPLGLLRWAEIDIEDLVGAIESRFEGTGTSEQTEITLFDRGEGGVNERTAEYQVGDTRYRMRMHSFVRADEMPTDKMFSQSVRRLQFLRRKLLEDFAESRKIFVYKRGHSPLRIEDAHRLSRALMAHSADNVLLCVYLAGPDRPAGTVERITPNLLFGYITHFSLAPGGHLRVPAYSDWDGVCRNAYALWRNGRASAEGSAVLAT